MNGTSSANTARRIALATAIAGTLDITLASIETVSAGKPVASMLRAVASGPVPPAIHWGAAGAALGLVVHYTIMAVMASVFMTARDRIGWARSHSALAGAIYGVGLWLVMYGLVLQFRFGKPFPSTDPTAIVLQLFAHVILVGLTFGLVSKRGAV